MSENKIKIDFAIVGGGIIGLWSAYLLKLKRPKLEIVLMEKNSYFGDETTGRNSGVLHSGLYYSTNSLKHLMCLEGYDKWIKFCELYKIPYHVCGKYLIASSSLEEEGLNRYFSQAKNNGVLAKRIGQQELEQLAQEVHCFEAFYVPSSGIIDIPNAVLCLKNLAEGVGVIILNEHLVEKVNYSHSKFELIIKTPEDIINVETQFLINAAGLGSVKIRKMLGLNDFENFWVKGNYLATSQRLKYKNLYYPVPPENLKGLGIHSTIDIAGQVKFGPNTQDIDSSDFPNYLMDPSELKKMLSGVLKLFKNIDSSKLYLDYCGIRPKLKKVKDSEVYTDFYLGETDKINLPNYYEFLGIESPGLTAAPALATRLVNLIFTE